MRSLVDIHSETPQGQNGFKKRFKIILKETAHWSRCFKVSYCLSHLKPDKIFQIV